MSLHQKIEKQKQEIYEKKSHLKKDIAHAKKYITSPITMSLTALGGLILGYFLIPNKMVKRIFKLATVASTAKQFLELMPRSGKKPRIKIIKK